MPGNIIVGFGIYIAQAQNNYKPALLVKAAGDTVRGYINYQEWDNNPKSIQFKSALNDAKPDKLSPDLLRGFEVLGMDKYISYVGNISIDQNVFPNVSNSLDTSKVRDTVFLQQVYTGQHLALLKHKDNIKTRFFIKEHDSEPVELKYYQYYTSNSTLRDVRLFEMNLSALAQKYNALTLNVDAQIKKARFAESDLSTVLMMINKDQVTKATGTGGSRFYAGILFNRTNTSFIGDNPLDGQKADSYIPNINVGVDFFINKYTQRFFIRTEIGLTANTPHFQYQLPEGQYSTSRQYAYSYKFKQYTATFSPQFIYNFYNKDNLKIYLGVGAGLNYSAYGDNKYMITIGDASTIFSDRYTLNDFWFNYIFRAGVFINKRVEVFAHYTPPAGYADYISFSIRNSTAGLGVHYLFGN